MNLGVIARSQWAPRGGVTVRCCADRLDVIHLEIMSDARSVA